MNWITAGFLMFFCSVAEYLLIRKAAKIGMPVSLQNLACFITPCIVYVILSFTTQTPPTVSAYQGLVLVVSAVLFSYLGSKWNLLSMKYAPNPGYALVIAKSYVVFTSLFALVVFGSELTVRSSIAIGVIVLFSTLVMIDPHVKPQPHVRISWIPLSLATFFCWGMLAVSSKYLLDIGVPIYTRLIYITGIVSGIILSDMRHDSAEFSKLTSLHWLLFVTIGLLFSGFNYFMQLGYQLAPNIGYTNAINAASIAFVTIGASIFFKDELNVRKLLGVFGVIAGLILLVL